MAVQDTGGDALFLYQPQSGMIHKSEASSLLTLIVASSEPLQEVEARCEGSAMLVAGKPFQYHYGCACLLSRPFFSSSTLTDSVSFPSALDILDRIKRNQNERL